MKSSKLARLRPSSNAVSAMSSPANMMPPGDSFQLVGSQSRLKFAYPQLVHASGSPCSVGPWNILPAYSVWYPSPFKNEGRDWNCVLAVSRDETLVSMPLVLASTPRSTLAREALQSGIVTNALL